jgi:hypothetical protein
LYVDPSSKISSSANVARAPLANMRLPATVKLAPREGLARSAAGAAACMSR